MHVHTSPAHPALTLLTPVEVANRLNVPIRWVYDHVESGFLPCRRRGRKLWFVSSELDAWLRRRLVGYPAQLTSDDSPLMTSAEALAHLRRSRTWLHDARRHKHLPHLKLDGLVRYSRPLLDAWVLESA